MHTVWLPLPSYHPCEDGHPWGWESPAATVAQSAPRWHLRACVLHLRHYFALFTTRFVTSSLDVRTRLLGGGHGVSEGKGVNGF